MLAIRVFAVVGFVTILAWLSVVIGVGVIDLAIRPWCSPGTACTATFWPRLGISAAGGVGGFLITGVGLLNFWDRRALLGLTLIGVALTAGLGVWFLPVVTG